MRQGSTALAAASLLLQGANVVEAVGKQKEKHAGYSVQSIDFRGRMLQEVPDMEIMPIMEVTDSLTSVYNSSSIPTDIAPDALIYGCTPAGLFAALRLLDPSVTQDTIREDVLSASSSGNLTVVIVEPSGRCGGRLFTANSPDSDYKFHAELGDMGYESSPSAYADVLMNYLGLETMEVDNMVADSNLMYLRGRHLRKREEMTRLGDIYAMTFVEQGEHAADLLLSAVESILPGALDMNETEWADLFVSDYAMADGTPLTQMGFWNALCQVLSDEAYAYVTAYYGNDSKLSKNTNALEGIISVVLSAGSTMREPVEGMESIVVELQKRVLELGGYVVLNAVMTDLVAVGGSGDNITDTSGNSTSVYDVTLETMDQGTMELTDVRNVIFATSGHHGMEELMATSEFFAVTTLNATNSTNGTTTAMDVAVEMTLPLVLDSRVEAQYARLVLCYDKPWWQSQVLDITSGRSVTDSPLRSVSYMDHGCLCINAQGMAADYWKGLYQGQNFGMEKNPDWNVFETRWSELEAPQVIITEAQRLLKIMHAIPYIPAPTSSLFVTDEIVGDAPHAWVVGLNPYYASQFIGRPKEDWNVFFIGEGSGAAFPYQGLEADLKSAEDLVQLYFYTQAEPLTFDSTGDLTSDKLSQMGLSISTSADGMRVAVVSTLPDDEAKGEVSVYQRIGDEFLGVWKEIGTNFIQNNVPVSFDLGGNTTSSAARRRRNLARRRRRLVDRVEMDNVTSVALSGDGKTMAIGIVDIASGSGYVQLYKDASMGNWTKYGEDIVDAATEFGFALDLSYDGNILAVGAPGADDVGAVMVYDCSMKNAPVEEDVMTSGDSASSAARKNAITLPNMQMCEQMGKTMEGISEVTRYGESVSLSYDGKVIATGAPNTGADLQGYVSVFAYSAERFDWNQVGSLLEGAEVDDQFGFSVSLAADGSSFAAGAPGTAGDVGGGYVRAYSYDAETFSDWVQTGSLEGETEEDNLGFSVALSGNGLRALVGAPQLESNGTGYVMALELDPSTLTWTVYDGSELTGEETGDMMGYAVASDYDGIQVAIGAPKGMSNQGVVKTYVYVQPAMAMVSSFDGIARSIWADATASNPYEWMPNEPCVESPLLKEDTTAAYAALVEGIINALQDPRLNPDVDSVMFFNSNDNDPMGNCTTLLDTAYFILENFDPAIDATQRAILDQAINAYELTLVATPTMAPVAVPTLAPAGVPTLPPSSSNITTIPPTAGNFTNTTGGLNSTSILDGITDAILGTNRSDAQGGLRRL